MDLAGDQIVFVIQKSVTVNMIIGLLFAPENELATVADDVDNM